MSDDTDDLGTVGLFAVQPVDLAELEFVAVPDGYVLKLDGRELPALADPPPVLTLKEGRVVKLTVTLTARLKISEGTQ